MATGYNEDGSTRLICVGPPDGTPDDDEGTDPNPNSLIPNCFHGMPENGHTPFNLTVGLGDLSFELWVRPNAPTEQDQGYYFGLTSIGIPSAEQLGIFVNPSATLIDIEYNIPGNGIFNEVPPIKWSHLAVNYDRNVQIEVYWDGVLTNSRVLTDAGAPTNWPALDFNPGIVTTTTLDDDENLNWAMGPIAVHGQILTTAQMRDSIGRRGVQLLATTFCAYDWRGIGGHTGWETNLDLLEEGIRVTSENIGDEIACPIGPNGGVLIPDLSGNNRNLAFWSNTVYLTDQGRHAFGRTIFFR